MQGRKCCKTVSYTHLDVYKRQTVHGYIVKPHAGRANRSMQHFFVNGRYVKSRLMQAAMEEAYRNAIITGKYPSGALFLDLPLSAVDVNVHRAKTEVKFSQEKPIFEVVYIACKNALAANDNMPHLEHKEKEAPAKTREDNLTHEQQRFAIPKPVDPDVYKRQGLCRRCAQSVPPPHGRDRQALQARRKDGQYA